MKYKNNKLQLLLFFTLCISQTISAQNAATPDSSFIGTLNGAVNSVLIQPDDKVVISGWFTNHKKVSRNRIARLNADGTLDLSFNVGTGADNTINASALQSNGKIIIGGDFSNYNGTTCKKLARLNTDGTLDNTFTMGTGVNAYQVLAIALQSDGKIIIGGSFTSYNGIPTKCLARLNSDGTLDNTFITGSGIIGKVKTIAVQSDGKLLIGGAFTEYNGTPSKNILRLNTDGSIDPGFLVGIGTSGDVNSLTTQSDGKIIMGGYFTTYQAVSVNGITRLNPDGSRDVSFAASGAISSSLFYPSVKTILIKSDDKIVVGGSFDFINATIRKKIVQLNSDGTIDNSFSIGKGIEYFDISAIGIRSDGKIIIGGNFSSFNEIIRNHIACLDQDGTLDPNFNKSNGLNGTASCTLAQKDGKLIIGGSYTRYNDIPVNTLIRLNKNLSLDTTFQPMLGLNAFVYRMAFQSNGKIILMAGYDNNGSFVNGITRIHPNGAKDNSFLNSTGADQYMGDFIIQPDGKIIIVGNFQLYNGTVVNRIVRLNNDGTLDNSFNTGTGFNYVADRLCLQTNGKIIVSGQFTTFNGSPCSRLIRLNTDGTIDNTFNTGTGPDAAVNSILVQSDGKIMIVGDFTHYNGNGGYYSTRIARINIDGSLDMTANYLSFGNTASISKIQEDGKIIVGGNFTEYGGIPAVNLVRINKNGTIDSTFNIGGTYQSMDIETMSFLPNGKIAIGGGFQLFNNIAYNNLLILNGEAIHFNSIRGKIYTDENNDCIKQPLEKSIPSILVKAMPGPYFGITDENGNYTMKVDSGAISYSISPELNNLTSKLFSNQCAPSHTIPMTGSLKDTSSFDFAEDKKECTLLNITIRNTRMRRCAKSLTYVDYCNYGTISSSTAQIKIEYPSYVLPINSIPMWTSKEEGVLIYDVGILPEDFCGKIVITDSVVCGNESIRGLTQCIKAMITPGSTCTIIDPGWDQSSIEVTSECIGGENIFTITNNGTGNMTDSLAYRLFENDTLIFKANYKLKSDHNFSISYPANGQTIRLEAEQHLLHPGESRPRSTLENCRTITSSAGIRNLVTTAPQDDLDEEKAVTCGVIIDSFDPNDKQVLPSGIGADNQIEPGEELEYTIRFQNCGTDTAYNVKVIDTLDFALEPSSFTKGVSSHPYTLEVTGNVQPVLSFNFSNINLPDSAKNNLGSNGLVSFRVTIPSSTSLGTSVRNKAYIYFDYNSPIITNETRHITGVVIEKDLTRGEKIKVGEVMTGINGRYNKDQVRLYPNPSTGIITIEKYSTSNTMELKIISTLGILQNSIKLNNLNTQEVNLQGTRQGIYIYEIVQDGVHIAGGILQIR